MSYYADDREFDLNEQVRRETREAYGLPIKPFDLVSNVNKLLANMARSLAEQPPEDDDRQQAKPPEENQG